MFDKVYTIELYHIYLGPKLNGFHFLVRENGAGIGFVNTHNPVRDALPAAKHLPLLHQYLFNNVNPLAIPVGKVHLIVILLPDIFHLQQPFFQQVQQSVSKNRVLFCQFLTFSAVASIPVFLLKYLFRGKSYLLIFAYQFELSIKPVNTFPQQFHIGRVTNRTFVTGCICEHDFWLFHE